MIRLTNFETGKQFGLKWKLIQLVTDTDDGVFVWTNFEAKVGFKVTNTLSNVIDQIDLWI